MGVDEALRLPTFLAVGIIGRVVPVFRSHKGPVDEVIVEAYSGHPVEMQANYR
jgi:hypothetical protein